MADPGGPTTQATRRPADVRQRVFRTGLRVFGAMPPVLRRGLVRVITPSYTVGAVCAIVCGDRVLVLRQPHREGWSLPGGLLSRREDAAAAVTREVAEETGLRVEVGRPVTTVVAVPVRRVDVVYRIEVDECFPVRAGGEAERAEWVPMAGLDEVDGPTRDILAALAEADRDGGHGGRVLGRP